MNEAEIGATLRARRAQLALTQQELADVSGLSRATIAALEGGRGLRGATLGTILRITESLGLIVQVVADDHD